eukprot:gene16654-19786_t
MADVSPDVPGTTAIFAVHIVSFSSHFAMVMVFPLLALVIEERDGTAFHTAAAFIAFKLASFFTTPLYSTFLDRCGLQKWVIMPCVLGTTFAQLILALAQAMARQFSGARAVPLLSASSCPLRVPAAGAPFASRMLPVAPPAVRLRGEFDVDHFSAYLRHLVGACVVDRIGKDSGDLARELALTERLSEVRDEMPSLRQRSARLAMTPAEQSGVQLATAQWGVPEVAARAPGAASREQAIFPPVATLELSAAGQVVPETTPVPLKEYVTEKRETADKVERLARRSWCGVQGGWPFPVQSLAPQQRSSQRLHQRVEPAVAPAYGVVSQAHSIALQAQGSQQDWQPALTVVRGAELQPQAHGFAPLTQPLALPSAQPSVLATAAQRGGSGA